jgi:hypothetical protein
MAARARSGAWSLENHIASLSIVTAQTHRGAGLQEVELGPFLSWRGDRRWIPCPLPHL